MRFYLPYLIYLSITLTSLHTLDLNLFFPRLLSCAVTIFIFGASDKITLPPLSLSRPARSTHYLAVSCRPLSRSVLISDRNLRF